MKRIIKKTGLIIVNGTTMVPLMGFLLFTNQNKEFDKLVGILKESVSIG